MKITDYFKVSFKRPEINETISQIIEKKTRLKSQLELCYSRLESIEICNSNSKSEDAIILSGYLALDIANLALAFSNLPISSDLNNWKEKIKSISNEEITIAFSKYILVQESNFETNEEKSEKIESTLSDLLYSIEKNIFKKNKSQFENPIDDHKRKSTIQIVASIVFLVFAINIGIKQYQILRPIKKDRAKIYYMNEQNPTANNANVITAEVNSTKEWLDVSFSLPNPTDVTDIKIEPVHQKFARFQLKHIKFLDANKKIIHERDFKLNNLGMVANSEKNEICCMEDLKPGKLVPEKFVELETTGNLPSFYIKSEPMKNIKEIVLSYRYIKNTERFAD